VAGRLLSLLRERPGLIVSLPANTPELARAAAEGGADALKVHLRVRHLASGTHFGDLTAERPRLEEVLAVGLPTGIVPGAGDRLPAPEEMATLGAMGFDFFDMFARDMPAWMLSLTDLTRVVAVDAQVGAEALSALEAVGAEAIEAAVVPPEGYGQPLRAADVATYRRLREATRLPIIVPTERAVTPEEALLLVGAAGVSALMIGSIVTGREAESVLAATRRYAAALAAAQP